MTGGVPDWFTRAAATPFRQSTIEVDGCPINVMEWGDQGKPGLMFVHGGAAHAHWWSFLAPLFTHRYHVAALDLSGHGHSGHRETYSHDIWAREILEACKAVDFVGPPVVTGHSLGGLVTIQAAATYGDSLAGAVIVDSPVRRPDPESEEGTRGRAFRAPGIYDDLKTALSHFHLIPRQPSGPDYIIDHVARHSLHRTPAGWTWKFDHRLFDHISVPMREQLASVRCRVALLRGESSVVVPPDTADYMYELMGRVSPVISIPEAHHHLILDQPLAFVAALRTLLADWEHSVPVGKRQSAAGPSSGAMHST